MSKTNGHILVIPEGLETQNIPQSERDQKVRDFYDMKTSAESDGDQVYADDGIYSQSYSYGNFISDLLYISWPELQQKPSLNGVTQRTLQLIIGTCKNPGFRKCSDVSNFLSTHRHATYAGFNIPVQQSHYIFNEICRLQWHEKWYTENPYEIIWPNNCDIFPCYDKIINILKRELQKLGKNIPTNNEEIVSAFHGQIMNHKGPDIHAYADEIGTEICKCNYYKEESVLSTLESRRNGGTLRKIFSTINKHGKQQFISIDFKHGMFEFLDHTGAHQGEYLFDGSEHKGPSAEDHSFRCMDEWISQGCP